MRISVTYIFVCEHALQFNTENFHCGNLHKEQIVQSVIGNLEYGLTVFQFLTSGNLYYTYYMRKCKGIKLAVHLGSVFN
jgi:hypothetical protein